MFFFQELQRNAFWKPLSTQKPPNNTPLKPLVVFLVFVRRAFAFATKKATFQPIAQAGQAIAERAPPLESLPVGAAQSRERGGWMCLVGFPGDMIYILSTYPVLQVFFCLFLRALNLKLFVLQTSGDFLKSLAFQPRPLVGITISFCEASG